MRTTLDIDDVVLSAARSLARAEGMSLGAAVSRLARRGLRVNDEGRRPAIDVSDKPFPVLTGDPTRIVTPELINEHRDGD